MVADDDGTSGSTEAAREVMAALRELTTGDEALLSEVLTSFLTTAAERIVALRQAVASHDADGLAAAAHSLRGLCSQLNARDLAELCRELEVRGLLRSLDGVLPVIERLATCLDTLGPLIVERRRGTAAASSSESR